MRTLSEMLADLRIELKDSGSLWSDGELTRAVQRSVSDLSRFLPRQRFYDLLLDFEVDDEAFTSPAAADNDKVVDDEDCSAKASGDTATMVSTVVSMDVPRPVAIAFTDADASITGFTVIVSGRDEDGFAITESFYFKDGLSQTGRLYFSAVTGVEYDYIAGNGAADKLNVGTATHVGVFAPLDNKPIRPSSVTVTSSPAGTTFAEDTDYVIDYIRGRLALKTGGAMAAGTAYLVDYDKSKIMIDLSVLPDFIGFGRAIYPTSDIPQSIVSCSVYGDILTVEGVGDESQANLADGKHIVIEYHAKHTPPATASPGSWKDFLDDTIMLSSMGYALLIKSRQYEHQSVTDLTSMRTQLTTISHTALGTALTAVGTELTNADTALAKINTYLVNNTNEDAKYWLTKITTDLTSLRTAVGTALDAANAYLDEVDTTDLGAATDSAEARLVAGRALINTVTIGDQPVEQNAQYSAQWQGIAAARTTAALAFIQEAANRLGNLRSYIEQALGWARVADGFAGEGAQRVAEAGAYIAQAQGYLAQIDAYVSVASQYANAAQIDLTLADRFRAEGLLALEEARATWRDPRQYIGDFSYTSLTQPGKYNE